MCPAGLYRLFAEDASNSRLGERAGKRYFPRRMNACIISVGTELVTGQCLETNAAWLSEQLASVGVQVIEHVTVGDQLQHLATTIRQCIDRFDLVVATGGLGPTRDDLTREALAQAIGRPLAENQEALRQIEAYFQRLQRPFIDANRLQALVPKGCSIIPNRRGTAPGLSCQSRDCLLFILPGVPAEMKAMAEESVLPQLGVRPGGQAIRIANVLCYGMSEARIGELLEDLMASGRNPSVGTTAKDAIITIRMVARAADPPGAQRLLDADVAEVRSRLGKVVFGRGDGTLQAAVAELLVEKRLTVGTAESCTGGLVAKRLTDIPGSSAYFLQGFVTYSNQAKTDRLGVPAEMIEREGAVSEAVAHAMAEGCRKVTGADVAISVTGIAGPSGGTAEKPVGLVYIGLADDRGITVKRFLFGEQLLRREIRDRTAKTALNFLRIHLLQ
ncbi:MAG: competence/damage-inducible protein A [Phycisphaerales bacterium]|nr:MAG: competence/damage-inducible protein A [Phycisphaerales bacterium]